MTELRIIILRDVIQRKPFFLYLEHELLGDDVGRLQISVQFVIQYLNFLQFDV